MISDAHDDVADRELAATLHALATPMLPPDTHVPRRIDDASLVSSPGPRAVQTSHAILGHDSALSTKRDANDARAPRREHPGERPFPPVPVRATPLTAAAPTVENGTQTASWGARTAVPPN